MSARTTSSCPETAKTSAPASLSARAALSVGNDWPEWVTASATAPRTASAAVDPLGKTFSDGVAPLHAMSLAHAVSAARALFADATTTLRAGHAARRLTAHCSATQSEHSTPTTTRSRLARRRRSSSRSARANAAAGAAFVPSPSKLRDTASHRPGRSAKSRPTTSPPDS